MGFGGPVPRLKLQKGRCDPVPVREATGLTIIRGLSGYQEALRTGVINERSKLVTFSGLPSGQYLTHDYSPIDNNTLSEYGRRVPAKSILEGIDFAVK